MLKITKLYTNDFTFELPQTKFNYFFSVIVNGNYKVCSGYGQESTGITINLQMEQSFVGCYKTLIDRVFDWSNLYGDDPEVMKEAKYLDKCENSPNVAIKIITWVI